MDKKAYQNLFGYLGSLLKKKDKGIDWGSIGGGAGGAAAGAVAGIPLAEALFPGQKDQDGKSKDTAFDKAMRLAVILSASGLGAYGGHRMFKRADSKGSKDSLLSGNNIGWGSAAVLGSYGAEKWLSDQNYVRKMLRKADPIAMARIDAARGINSADARKGVNEAKRDIAVETVSKGGKGKPTTITRKTPYFDQFVDGGVRRQKAVSADKLKDVDAAYARSVEALRQRINASRVNPRALPPPGAKPIVEKEIPAKAPLSWRIARKAPWLLLLGEKIFPEQ